VQADVRTPESKEAKDAALQAEGRLSGCWHCSTSRAREAGFDAYLVKPVELDELRAVLGSLAREREGTRSSAW